MNHFFLPAGLILALLVSALFSPAGQCQPPADTFLGKDMDQWETDLSSSEARVRRNAAFALGKLGLAAHSQLPKLLQVFEKDRDNAVKDAAAYAIGEICKANPAYKPSNANQIVNSMKKALVQKDLDPMIRRSAAFALGSLGKSAAGAVKELDQVLKDASPLVKQNAAWALGEIGPSGIKSLTRALSDSDPFVIRDAAASLARIETDWSKHSDRIGVLSALAKKLNHADIEVKKAVAQSLVKIVEPADAELVGPPLMQLLKNNKENWEIQLNAAVALGNIGGQKAAVAIPFLHKILETGEPELRQQVAAVLGNFGKPAVKAVPALQKALTDPNPILKKNAATSLGGIGNDIEPTDLDRKKITAAVPDLVKLLGNKAEQPDVREAAAIALKGIGKCPELDAAEATRVMIATLSDKKNPPRLRAVTLWPLRYQSGIAANENLFDELNRIIMVETPADNNKMLRYDSAYLLSKYKKAAVHDKVLDTLLEFLKDTEVFIATGTKGVGGGAGEHGVGSSGVEVTKGSDGRIIALQALVFIVNEKDGGDPERVLKRNDLMQQMEALANNPKIDEDVRNLCDSLLKYLKS